MALAFISGDKVRQKVKPIEGEVKSAQIVGDEVHFTVQYVGEDGQPHERTFTEEQIEKTE